MDDKQLKFLGMLYASDVLSILEHLNKAKDGSLALDFDISEPEAAFYWGQFLACASVVTAFHEQFKINLFEIGLEHDEEGKALFAKDLLAMCIDLEQKYHNHLEDDQVAVQPHHS